MILKKVVGGQGLRKDIDKKTKKINLVEDLVDALEEEAVQVCIGDGEVQMHICEEPLDLSFVATPKAELLGPS